MEPITLQEIEYASSVLFNGDPNKFYDDIEAKTGERVEAIKCIESRSIVACPGSGKTTVLIAKLIILARRMPFDDGRGICVLTHTNVAIDLIKEKLGVGASKLFNYPNFFGTIQSFVDKYLAVQMIIEKYSKRPDRIDIDSAEIRLKKEFNYLPWNSMLKLKLFTTLFASNSEIQIKNICEILDLKSKEAKRVIKMLKDRKIINGTSSPFNLNYQNTKNPSDVNIAMVGITQADILSPYLKEVHQIAKKIAKDEKEQFENLKFLSINWEKQTISDNNTKFGMATPSGIDFKKIKERCFKDGLISFQDAYDFGCYYLFKHTDVKKAFRQRFKFIFVDEMQDTAQQQSNIIDKLFKESEESILQVFGDTNQAIYDYDGQKGDWNPIADESLFLTNSKRFGQNIANVINPLRVYPEEWTITGENKDSILTPYLIIYNEDNKESFKLVFDEFGKLIVDNKLHLIEKSKFVAIGRVSKEKDDGKITLKTYWEDFEKESSKSKEYYTTLIEYLGKELPRNKINYSERIINAILHFLDIHDFKNEIEIDKKKISRRFSKTTFFDYLKRTDEELYHSFKARIAHWSMMIKIDDLSYNTNVHSRIIKFLSERILGLKGKQLINKDPFLKIPDSILSATNGHSNNKNQKNQQPSNIYHYKYDEGKTIPIKINTIHGEKGETHTATLYLETYYNKKHDYERISEQINGNKLPSTLTKDHEMAAKLAYVAMSRPERLLCFAVSSKRISKNDAEKKLQPLGWKIKIVP